MTFARCVIVGAQAGLSNVFENEENVTETCDWVADPAEYEEEQQEQVEEPDAYYGNNDERDEDFPQDDVDLEEQKRSVCHDRNGKCVF